MCRGDLRGAPAGFFRLRYVVLLFLTDILAAALIVLGNYYFLYEAPIRALNRMPAQLPQAENNLDLQVRLPDPSEGTGIQTSSDANKAPLPVGRHQTLGEKFAERFSDTVVSSDTGYSSANLSVEVTRHTMGSGDSAVTYYVADIYLADIASFQTEFAGGQYDPSGQREHLADMSRRKGAVLAVNGDSYCFNRSHCNGLLVRNGTVYRNNPTTQDICVLYQDGSMSTYSAAEFNPQAALNRGVLDTWIFGPRLLDSDGKALTSFDTWGYIKKVHPRTAIGYYEPGHYCFVAVDGRQTGYSRGMSLPELAKAFEDLGCAAAYNLDGGHTTFLTLNSRYVNHSYKPDKTITDCIFIREPEEAQ